MGLLLANGSMSSNTNNEGEIRKALIEADLVECMVALPGQGFTNTQIPACIWLLTKDKANGLSLDKKKSDRRGKTLFIDARNLGYMKDRVLRDFTQEDEDGIPRIATNCIKNESLYPVYEKRRYVSDETYKNWFRGHPEPQDIIFVCKGSPGRVAWTPNPVPFCIAQDMVAIRADETKIHPKYLFALLRSRATQDQILNMHDGTLILHFNKGDSRIFT